ncbi:response regulator transcription factor [Chitinophaga rhizosphaerae]|uniref:response regulator transcription factor n=1 Tax=Chitinophaga rhizosphaerae TaxID=1864947 RepID=UPI000F8047E2|nr:response regulator [Chitinophaga rhizosphaerae]
MNNTILLIEDKPSLSDALKSLLELHQYTVATAANGEEGIRAARKLRPGLVISDIYMPVLNGLDLLDSFRDDPALQDIPVVMLTARSEIDDIQQALERGAAGYVTKPFLFKNLHAVIRGIFEKQL